MNESQHPFSGRLLFGIVLLSFGLLWTADNLGIAHTAPLLLWWPLLLVAFGAVRLSRWGGERQVTLGIICVGMGLLALADQLGWVHVGLGVLWPLAVMAIGIQILVRGSRATNALGMFGVEDSADYVRSFALMGGASTRSTSQALRGIELSAVMGGVELDLRGARPAEAKVPVDAFAFMGGIDIVVPPNWRVEFRATPMMGAMQDAREPSASDETLGTLVVRGIVVLGGIRLCSEPSGRTYVVGVSRRARRDGRGRSEVHVGPMGVRVRTGRGDDVQEVVIGHDPGTGTENRPTEPPPPTEPR